MQASDTKRLARKIRRIRERKRGKKLTPWRAVCETLDIRTENGDIDPGLACKIGYKEYEPAGRELRRRLGLRDRCAKCKRPFRAVKPIQVRRAPSPAQLWWKKMKREDREKLIELSYKNYLKWRNER